MEEQQKTYPLAETLIGDLMALATAYAKAKNIKISMVGVHVRNDQRFFADKVPRGAFTVRTYETTIRWFHDNWPDGAEKWCSKMRKGG